MNRITILAAALLLTVAAVAQPKNYHFDGKGISKEVLENYLERAVTMVYFLIPDNAEGRRVYNYHADDIRMVKNMGAKFIGRAIYRWGGEALLNSAAFWDTAKAIIQRMHAEDKEMIFQGCLFEIVTQQVEQVPVPDWVLRDFGLPVTTRNFSYGAMLNKQGKLVDHWRPGSSVPDISELETQLWFYYQAGAYMKIGCEAFHLGQIELIGMNDPNREAWAKLIAKIRAYAAKNARRQWVLLDAHTPRGGMLYGNDGRLSDHGAKDNKSLLDFNSFPLRVKEIPGKPIEGKLEVNFLDGLYLKSKGGTTPSGWTCKQLPYLVEFDNFGRGKTPNVADTTDHFVWGWDEISWFSLQTDNYRNNWLRYAHQWLRHTDPNGHLQMPGNRMITCPNESQGSYRANTKSEACPVGYGQEATIKALWTQ